MRDERSHPCRRLVRVQPALVLHEGEPVIQLRRLVHGRAIEGSFLRQAKLEGVVGADGRVGDGTSNTPTAHGSRGAISDRASPLMREKSAHAFCGSAAKPDHHAFVGNGGLKSWKNGPGGALFSTVPPASLGSATEMGPSAHETSGSAKARTQKERLRQAMSVRERR